MNISNLMDAISDLLVNDSTIESFCQTNWQKSPTIFFGFDEDNLPPLEKYPIIVVPGIARSARGEGQSNLGYEIPIGIAVVDEEREELPKKVNYRGLKRVEKLREIVEEAFLASQIGDIISVNGQTITETIFPIFSSITVFEVQIVENKR